MSRFEMWLLRMWVMLLIIMLVIGGVRASAQGVCDPFTTSAPPNAVPVGTGVSLIYFEWSGPVQKLGVVEAYAVRTCWPGGFYPPGLDDVAYVISYGDARGARVVLNRNRFEVR
jgi:hypothetical protein